MSEPLHDKTFYEEFIEGLKIFINNQLKIDISENLFTILELCSWVSILFLIDFILRSVSTYLIQRLANRTKFKWIKILYLNKLFISIIHIITLTFASNMNPILFADKSVYFFVQRVTELALIIVFTQFIFRIINTVIDIYNEENSYTTVGIRTFGQMMKFIVSFFAIISGIMVLFTVDTNTIITVLGAMTAAILLIFRDAIFGFVSGLQISYSKIIKVGDWVTLSKGNVEGIVKEININLVRIEKFDKTIATIPTVDVVSSQVTNHMPMLASGTRIIKRSISFNVNSFNFCDEETLDRFESYTLIQNYIQKKRTEIKENNKKINDLDLDINGQKLTNIGVFRIYVQNYLKNIPAISINDPIIVRQLPVTMEGMPLEISCFIKAANTADYERIQSDIFDHLLTASRKFDLLIMQSISAFDLKR